MRRLRWTFAILTAVMALAACGSNASTSLSGAGGVTPVSSSTTPSAVLDPLTGTWRNTFTCHDMAKALDRAGLQKYEKQVLPQFGDCDGVKHTTFAFADGALTITTNDGKTSPPLPYHVVNDHTYVQGFLRNTYRVQGNSLIFVDTQIIKALYPYDPKIIPRENAFDVAWLESAPFKRVS